MSPREAAPAPRLPGYTFQSVLGGGGAADVYVYEQQLPRRAVAVKVLLPTVGDAEKSAFEREADLTARVSGHPSIVTVYQAGVTEDGREFLVMEFCSRPNLGQRYRTERIGVAEVLQIGVRLACAVETMHRAGIVHRDIKPANVLANDLGRPILSDFGIAAPVDDPQPAQGMSIPWAAPELLAAVPQAGPRADVYSLAATLYSALAGRSPFERPGGQNDAADLVGRIERGIPTPFTRDDVPARLRTVLARAMAADPSRRHAQAVELAMDLRAVEADLGLPLTPLDLGEESGALTVGGQPGVGVGDPDATRARGVHQVEAQPRTAVDADATRARTVTQVSPVAPGAPAFSGAPVPALDDDSTRMRPVRSVPPGQAPLVDPTQGVDIRVSVDPEPRQRRIGRLVAGIVSAVVLVAAVAVVVLVTRNPDRAENLDNDQMTAPAPTVGLTVPTPVGLTGVWQADGSVVFTWTNPDPQDGDSYLWGVRSATGLTQLQPVEEEQVTIRPEDLDDLAGQVCVEVSVVRADRRASTTPAEGCTP
ncbi:serine/threonine-protein kinase [Cellulomonas sp. NPDC089187]|uniref:serine/threonine-protein kinase n=1 Tax=Cellulomonas sp. NPDC089187 TaxID=3154970 RepID=UPI003436E67B